MQGLTRTTTLSLTLVATTTWADTHFVAPGQSIQAAVDAAADGDVIELGSGEHVGSVEIMARDLRFQGQGPESTVWRGNNSGMVDATYSNVEFDGITFADGQGTLDGLVRRGGAMFFAGGTADIANCAFQNNTAKGGGAIAANNTDLNIAHSTFLGNKLNGGLEGGEVILSIFSYLNLDSCEFEQNGWGSTGFAYGTVESIYGDLTATNCYFNNNRSTRSGAFSVNSGDATLAHCTFVENHPYANYAYDADVTYLNSLFMFNGGSDTSAGANLNTASSIQYGGCVVQDQQMIDSQGDNPPLGVENLVVDAPESVEVVGFLALADSPAIRSLATGCDSLYPNLDSIPETDLTGAPRPWSRMVGAVEHTTGSGFNQCLADLNEDTTVDYQDLILLISRWGVTDTFDPADWDADGFIGLPELMIMLSDWGACS